MYEKNDLKKETESRETVYDTFGRTGRLVNK